MMIALGYLQAIQFTHKAHTLVSTIERIEESAQLANNNDISCLICYYLQHSHVELYLSTAIPSLPYQAKATILYVNHTDETLLSFLSIRNNKSPPYAYSLS